MLGGLSSQTVEKITRTFLTFPEIEKAVLYGSRAKGTYKTGSDIDLILYGKNLTEGIRDSIASTLDDLLLPYTIDLSISHSLTKGALLDHIQRVGITFYTK